MIIKSFEIRKINQNKSNIILIYGENEGLKNNILDNLIKGKNNIFKYEEKDILDKNNEIIESNYSKSLFEDKKNVIIKRGTDKILKTVEEILEKKIEDLNLIINSNNLEKRSKLRSFFEKNKSLVTVPFYEDQDRNLTTIVFDFINKNKIKILISLDFNAREGKAWAACTKLYKIWTSKLKPINKNQAF